MRIHSNLAKNSGMVCWKTAISRLEGAYSEGTLKAYRSDFTRFEDWCAQHNYMSLPATPETVAHYITDITADVAVSTLQRRLAAIRKIHRVLKLDNPVADEDITIAMRRAKRMKITGQRQALGLTKELKDKLIKACPNTLTGLRDQAMISVGYDALCRRSELVALRVEDLKLTTRRGGSVTIRRSKNDPFGQGRTAYISAKSVKYLKEWIRAAEIKADYLFCRIDRNGYVSKRPLHGATVAVIIKKRAQEAKMPQEKVKALTGHSMRVGAAQDMMKSGIDLLPIMKAGGWKTIDVVGRYVEHGDLRILLKSFFR